jgi:hypothetical protein
VNRTCELITISIQYKHQLSNEILKIGNGLVKSIDEHWHEYKTTITTVAERILGEMDKRRRSD